MNNCSEIWPNICRSVFTLTPKTPKTTPKTPGSTRGQRQSLCIISLMNYVTELISDTVMDYVAELISDSVMEKIRCSLRNSFCYHLQITNQCMKFLLFQRSWADLHRYKVKYIFIVVKHPELCSTFSTNSVLGAHNNEEVILRARTCH